MSRRAPPACRRTIRLLVLRVNLSGAFYMI
jgi:hypothetical protein